MCKIELKTTKIRSSVDATIVQFQRISGSVESKKYSVYSIVYKGRLRIAVTSVRGDVDIYISLTSAQPTFENYDFVEATCGDDMLVCYPATINIRVTSFGYYINLSGIK